METLLRQLNLTQYEIKAYLTLLKVDAVTAYQLGNLSKIPQGRIYDIVESLVAKGIVSVLPGTPRLVRAINPKVGLKALLVKKEREWRKEFTQLDQVINKLEQKEEKENVSLEKGENLYYQNLVELHGKVKRELLSILGGLTATNKGFDLFTPSKMLIKKKGEIKAIVPIDKHNKKVVKKMKRIGIQVKDYPVKNFRMHIVDGKYALLTIVDKKDRNIIKINQKEAVQTLREMFLALWEKAEEIK